MKPSMLTAPVLAGALLLANVSAQAAGLSGAIFTTNSNGSQVNGNQYDSPCSVYLNGGPGPHAPATAAGLPDGYYYFQVTDPSGKALLSTDPVSNRSFHVTGGVIVAYTGIGTFPHFTGMDSDEPGAVTIRLANLSCGNSAYSVQDFLPSPNNGGTYKVWATSVNNFIGDPNQVDNPCGTGCFHGFVPSSSKTDNFKVNAAASTFCLTVDKIDQASQPVGNWQFFVTDPLGTTNAYFTDPTGTLNICSLIPGAYTVAEASDSTVMAVWVNGTAKIPAATSVSFSWSAGQVAPVILFQNSIPVIGIII